MAGGRGWGECFPLLANFVLRLVGKGEDLTPALHLIYQDNAQ